MDSQLPSSCVVSFDSQVHEASCILACCQSWLRPCWTETSRLLGIHTQCVELMPVRASRHDIAVRRSFLWVIKHSLWSLRLVIIGEWVMHLALNTHCVSLGALFIASECSEGITCNRWQKRRSEWVCLSPLYITTWQLNVGVKARKESIRCRS